MNPPWPALSREQPRLWDDIKGVDLDPEIRRRRILASDLDRQSMGSGGEAGCSEVDVLWPFRQGIRIDVLDEGSVQEYVGDPRLRPAGADPAHRRSGKSERGLRTRSGRGRGRPGAPRLARVTLRPAG